MLFSRSVQRAASYELPETPQRPIPLVKLSSMSDPPAAAPAPVPVGGRRPPVEDWTDGATDQAIAIAIEARDKENPPGEGDSISGSLMTQNDGGACEK